VRDAWVGRETRRLRSVFLGRRLNLLGFLRQPNLHELGVQVMLSIRFASLCGSLGFGIAAVIPLLAIDIFFFPRTPGTPISLEFSANVFLVTGIFLPTSTITLIANHLRTKTTRHYTSGWGILACYGLLGLALNPIVWMLIFGTLGLYFLLAPFSIFSYALICTAVAHTWRYFHPA